MNDIKAFLGEELYRTTLIGSHLVALLAEDPITGDDQMDLNPQIRIRDISQKVIDRVEQECPGLSCTHRNVLEVWLIRALFMRK